MSGTLPLRESRAPRLNAVTRQRGCSAAFPVSFFFFLWSGEGFCHCAHLDFNDPRARGLFAGQQNRVGHVFGLQHVRVADPFLRPPPAKCKLGLHASGTDHADLDAVRSQFPIKRLRKTDLRELRGTVNRFAPKTVDARHRRNHQNGALLLLKHDRNRVTGEQKRGAHVGVHEIVIFLSACVDEVLIIAHASVVNQDVDLPEGPHCGFDRVFRCAFLSGIAEHADGLRAHLFCLLLELVEPLLAPRREHQSRALFGQGTRASLSDAGACAGDQSHFTTEFCSHILFISCFKLILSPVELKTSRGGRLKTATCFFV